MAHPKKKLTAKGKPGAHGSHKKKPALSRPARKAERPAAKKTPPSDAPDAEPSDEEVELDEEVEVAEEALEAQVVARNPGRSSLVEIEERAKARAEAAETDAEEISTEELWTLYRKEVASKAVKDPKHLEGLRNHLIERHYPLVRYIAERLLQTLPT